MSAFRVILARLQRVCPSCKAPIDVHTHPRLGTVSVASCSPYTCRIARVIALAGGKPHGYEPVPVDDRHTRRGVA